MSSKIEGVVGVSFRKAMFTGSLADIGIILVVALLRSTVITVTAENAFLVFFGNIIVTGIVFVICKTLFILMVRTFMSKYQRNSVGNS